MPPLDAPPPVSGLSRLVTLAEQVEAAVASGALPEATRPVRAQCIDALAALPSGGRDEKLVAQACRLTEQVIQAGWVDEPATAAAVIDANAACRQGWNGLLTSLLLAPAWQNDALPTFERTPLAFWRTLSVASFRLPLHLFALGQADAMLQHRTERMRELATLAKANPGSSGLRSAAAAAEEAGDPAILAGAAHSSRDYLQWRGRLRQALRGRQTSEPTPAFSREGRFLMVGVLLPSLNDVPATRAALSWWGHLDRKRFQVVAFAPGKPDAAVQDFLSAAGIDVRFLPETVPAALATLVEASLDIAVYATRAGDPADYISQVLLHRVAPLQVATDARGATTGLPQADAALCGVRSAEGREVHFTERLLAVPEAGLSPLPRLAQSPAGRTWSREGLGLDSASVLFSSAAPFALLTPEWAARVARIMAEVPSARLLVYSAAIEDSGPSGLNRVCGTLAPVFAREGIDARRLMISNEAFGGPADIVALLSQADLHLDAFPATDAEGCRAALEAGVPVLTVNPAAGFDGSTVALLRSLGQGDCVAADETTLCASAIALGLDAESRRNLREALGRSLAAPGAFADPLVRAEGISRLLETAFDAACAGEFRSPDAPSALRLEPLPEAEALIDEAGILLDSGLAEEALSRLARCVAHAPGNLRARGFYYRALIAAGDSHRAEAGLVAASHPRTADPETWSLLAQARLRQGKRVDAIAALRVSLSIAPKNLATWAVLDDLAKSGGHHDLAQEVSACLATLTTSAAESARPAALGKCLYFSPVGKGGKAFLAEMLQRLPAEQFDILVVSYDGTDFSDLGERVRVISDRGQKWSLVKRHLTPETVAAYDYVFIWDDDIDPHTFDGAKFVEILRRNDLDIAQPSLTADCHSFHPITVTHPTAVGRATNFVEIMVPAYSSRIWPQFYRYLDPELNELGWGYDFIPLGKKGIVDCMAVRHTRPGQSAKAGAQEQFAAWSAKYHVRRPALVATRDLE